MNAPDKLKMQGDFSREAATARGALLLLLRDWVRIVLTAVARDLRGTARVLALFLSIFTLCFFSQAGAQDAKLPEKHRALVKAHCLDCHNSDTREGKVDLETLSFDIATVEEAELWQKVLNALNAGVLADYYGITGVTGDEFRKVKLPADSPRGGLLGMAAIHAMGSDGIVSSPVERGAWVLRHLLNDPPPPAPPNVPQISRLEGQVLTTRERLLAHQEEAQCASCHRKIDPIGFGLENFDAAGKWRTQDSYRLTNAKGRPIGKGKTWTIDPSGAFHKGPSFKDYYELRDLIAEREEDFARGFTEHLIEYALGRPFGFTDEGLASEIVGSAKSKQFAVSEFIYALVQSKTFRTK